MLCSGNPSENNCNVNATSSNNIIEKYCWGNNEINPNSSPWSCNNGVTCGGCDTDGALYQWNEAMGYVETVGAQGICPTGWHIPSDAEWGALAIYLGSNSGTQLKTTAWDNGTNDYNFTALPVGDNRFSQTFSGRGSITYFWTSSPHINVNYAYDRYLITGNSNINSTYDARNWGFAVRCIKN